MLIARKTCVTIDYSLKKGRLMWSVELLPIAVPLIRVLNTIPHATAATHTHQLLQFFTLTFCQRLFAKQVSCSQT